ncbi:hypothetical protein ABZ438_35470 [Streptomyces sp. NPDC005786]|uniref:hypothetical protein n=1 Tax=Streptomyces sp. NPDC005786 TaxID=3154891 RepID=UPI0033DD012E
MPARPRIPDPRKGELEKFVFDLRALGMGKAGVSWIAAQRDTEVSRPALYAALSGTRLPYAETVSTLLRWWVGNPDDERVDVRSRDPIWGWIQRLPAEHEARTQANEWRDRYQRLARTETQRWWARSRTWKPTPPVQIDIPREQHTLIAQLNNMIERTGLEQDMWLLFGSDTLRIERYLSGKVIPSNAWCVRVVQICEGFALETETETEYEIDRLCTAAELARLARVRERRIARKTSRAATHPPEPRNARGKASGKNSATQ